MQTANRTQAEKSKLLSGIGKAASRRARESLAPASNQRLEAMRKVIEPLSAKEARSARERQAGTETNWMKFVQRRL